MGSLDKESPETLMEDRYQTNRNPCLTEIPAQYRHVEQAYVLNELTHRHRPPSGCPTPPSAPHRSDRTRAVQVNDSGTHCSPRCSCTQRAAVTCHAVVSSFTLTQRTTRSLQFSWSSYHIRRQLGPRMHRVMTTRTTSPPVLDMSSAFYAVSKQNFE